MLHWRVANGFTSIELMIVVAILAILAAITILAHRDYVIRAQVSEGMNLDSGAKASVWGFVTNTGRFPTSDNSAGPAKNTSIGGSYVSRVNVAGGKITVLFQAAQANAAINDASKYLVLPPITHGGSIA